MKQIFDNEKMVVMSNEDDTVVITNKVSDTNTCVQVIDDGFNIVYSEGDTEVYGVSILDGTVTTLTDTNKEEVEEEEVEEQ